MSLLFPAAALRRVFRRRHRSAAEARSDVGPASPVAGAFLGAVLRLEQALAAMGLRAPFGLSVFCVAERR
jgi:hypothetical protein